MIEVNLDDKGIEKYKRHGIASFSLDNLTWEGIELIVTDELENMKAIWMGHNRLIMAGKDYKNIPNKRLIIREKNLIHSVRVVPSNYDIDFQRNAEYQTAAGSIFPHGKIEVNNEFLDLYKKECMLFRRKVGAFDGVYTAVAPIYKD